MDRHVMVFRKNSLYAIDPEKYVRWASQRGQSGEQNRVLASRKNASSASQQMHFFDLIGSLGS